MEQGVVEGAQRGHDGCAAGRAGPGAGDGGRRERPGGSAGADRDGEPPWALRGPLRHGLARPGERGRGLGERQGGGVLRVQPPLGRGTGVPPQPGPVERVLRVVEGRGQRDAPPGRVGSAHGEQQPGDGVVHTADRVPLPVETVVAGVHRGRRQRQPQREQPAGPAEEEQRADPARFGQRHPGPDRGGDQKLGTGPGGHGSDGTDGSGEQSEPGENEGERHGAGVLSGVRTDEQTGGPGEGRYPEPFDGDPSTARPVVDPRQHGAEGGDHSE